jgi:hypothetical protein
MIGSSYIIILTDIEKVCSLGTFVDPLLLTVKKPRITKTKNKNKNHERAARSSRSGGVACGVASGLEQ